MIPSEAINTLEALVKQHPDGMLPAHPCRQCGKPLGEVPAEVYLGTYTGLCYTCQNGAAYPIHTHASGAVTWSHPPHCPAWRRDRERFIAFDGCPTCNGKGRIMIPRCNSQGGSYPMNCPDCSTRHDKHPLTVRQRENDNEASIMHRLMGRKPGVRAADVILHELARTGHATHAAMNKAIAKRLTARGMTL